MNALERPPVAPGLSAGHPTPKEPRLPPLREDLRLHEGPDADDGSPTWVLEDPARDQFFQLGVFQAECLKRWHLGTAKAVAAAVGKETLLRPTAETVENFAKFLMRMSLTREAGTSARLAEQMKRKPKQTLWKFFLHHYLFFRIPLVAPDAFLRRTLLFHKDLSLGHSNGARFGALPHRPAVGCLYAYLLAFLFLGRRGHGRPHDCLHEGDP